MMLLHLNKVILVSLWELLVQQVSKDAASMILTDDNFSTIGKSCYYGDVMSYRNIKNSINYLLSGNFAGIVCVFVASLLFVTNTIFPCSFVIYESHY